MPFLKKVAEIKPKYIDENGIEREVDTTVVPSNREGYAYENTTNSLKTFFKEKIAGYEPVLIETSKGFVTWQLFGAMYRDEYGNEEWIERVREDSVAEVEGDTVTYPDSIVGIDDEFVVQPGMLKHNIVIHKLPTYKGTLPGEEIVLAFEGRLDFPESFSVFADEEEKTTDFRTTGKIELRDSEGNVVFYMPEPTAYEESGEAETPCYYDVIMGNDFIRFLVETPLEWLADAERQYPVVVDPTVAHLDHLTMGFLDHCGNFLSIKVSSSTVHLYELVDGKLVYRSMFTNGSSGGGSTLHGAFFDPSGKNLIVLEGNGTAHFFSVDSGGNLTKLFHRNLGGYVTGDRFIVWHPSSKLFIHTSRHQYSHGSSLGLYYFDGDNITGLTFPPEISASYSDTFVFSTNGRYLIQFKGSRVRVLELDFSTEPEVTMTLVSDQDTGVSDAALQTRFAPSIDSGIGGDYITLAAGYGLYALFDPYTLEVKVKQLPEGRYTRVHPSGKYIVLAVSGNFIAYRIDPYTLDVLPHSRVEMRIPELGAEHFIPNFVGEDYVIFSTTTGNAMHLFRFYTPEGLSFYDSEGVLSTEVYTNRTLDFGVLTEGEYSDIVTVVLRNHKDMPVKDLTLQVEGELHGDLVEFSKTLDPFVPETFLHYPETLDVGERVTFYIRVKPHPDNIIPLRKIPISARAIYAL